MNDELGANAFGVLEKAAKLSFASIPDEDGDYEDGGFLYCGKCRTPKETEVKIGCQRFIARCLCRCAEERREAENKRKEQTKAETMRKSWVKGYEHMTFANSNENSTAMKMGRKLAAKLDDVIREGMGCVFVGNPGTGKTWGAAAVANEAIDRGYRAYIASIVTMIKALRVDEDAPIVLNRLSSFDFVVIDDLGAERDTEYANEKVYEIIDTRLRSGKATIVTTNIETDDPRIKSRLSEYITVNCSGDDLRNKNGDMNKARLREILLN